MVGAGTTRRPTAWSRPGPVCLRRHILDHGSTLVSLGSGVMRLGAIMGPAGRRQVRGRTMSLRRAPVRLRGPIVRCGTVPRGSLRGFARPLGVSRVRRVTGLDPSQLLDQLSSPFAQGLRPLPGLRCALAAFAHLSRIGPRLRPGECLHSAGSEHLVGKLGEADAAHLGHREGALGLHPGHLQECIELA